MLRFLLPGDEPRSCKTVCVLSCLPSPDACTQVLDMLLSAGADVNAAEGGALCSSVAHGHAETVSKLLGAGADVTMLEDDVEALCHAAEVCA